jgi:3-phosphoshikimate 1-carboxyvinyltransferase
VIDEIPILAVAAAAAQGTTVIKDAAELRLKESDRLQALAEELGKVGADIKAQPDGLVITGPTRWRGGEVDSRGDHRIAMALLMVAAISEEQISVKHGDSVNVSFPNFQDVLRALREGKVGS